MKKKFSFLFYDYETFGLHTRLDKIAQFACIRTDVNFNIISKPILIYCTPPLDYLPDPLSIFITKIIPQCTLKKGMNEFFFSKKIYEEFIKHNTCILGFNNINFDDEFTRNIFYRNLLDPYGWSYKNNNSRWDLINVLRACYVFRPNGIIWPKKKSGLISFKLEDIAKCNKIQHLHAHNALSDVYATIEIAKLIKNAQPNLFNFFFNHRTKKQLINLFYKYKYDPIFYVSNIFGSCNHNVSMIKMILCSTKNATFLICFDLKYDFSIFLKVFLRVKNFKLEIKKLFETGLIVIYLNKCPIFAPLNVLDNTSIKKLNINLQKCIKNFVLIDQYIYVFKEINNFLIQKKNWNFINNVDLKLYENFFNVSDQKKMEKIHNIYSQKCFIKNVYFQDYRLNDLFFRMKARNFFTHLTYSEKKKWYVYCKHVFSIKYIRIYKKKLNDIFCKNIMNNIDKKIYYKIYDYFLNLIKKFY
ncbi:exodeoxyribonuclease I [Buchnera aphidicola]|uniref:exodeoxyribonuclease I n=1 Tax=Buchnera aphidicola TaxID=9 RepID=UPI0016514640|nr:exodeoxyribonuclease I [Buchnera aphidicola]